MLHRPDAHLPAAAGNRRLKREIVWVIVIKLIAITMLWQWFVHPQQVHVDTRGAAASVLGRNHDSSSFSPPSARHDQ